MEGGSKPGGHAGTGSTEAARPTERAMGVEQTAAGTKETGTTAPSKPGRGY